MLLYQYNIRYYDIAAVKIKRPTLAVKIEGYGSWCAMDKEK